MRLEIGIVGEGRTSPAPGVYDIHPGLPTATIEAFGAEFRYWLLDGVTKKAYPKLTIKMDRSRLAVAYFMEVIPPPPPPPPPPPSPPPNGEPPIDEEPKLNFLPLILIGIAVLVVVLYK